MPRKVYTFDDSYLNALDLGGSPHTIVTVPADKKLVIKEFRIHNNSGSEKTISIYVTRGGTDYYYESGEPIASGGSYDKLSHLILIAGDVLKINASGNLFSFVSGMIEDSSS